MHRTLYCFFLLLAACAAGPADTGVAEHGAIAAGITSGVDGVSSAQARTFLVDVQGNWAAAYDPGNPPGCEPGGLSSTGAAPVPATPCTVYLLERRKTRWGVVSHGLAGKLIVPDSTPAALGHSEHLSYLGQ